MESQQENRAALPPLPLEALQEIEAVEAGIIQESQRLIRPYAPEDPFVFLEDRLVIGGVERLRDFLLAWAERIYDARMTQYFRYRLPELTEGHLRSILRSTEDFIDGIWNYWMGEINKARIRRLQTIGGFDPDSHKNLFGKHLTRDTREYQIIARSTRQIRDGLLVSLEQWKKAAANPGSTMTTEAGVSSVTESGTCGQAPQHAEPATLADAGTDSGTDARAAAGALAKAQETTAMTSIPDGEKPQPVAPLSESRSGVELSRKPPALEERASDQPSNKATTRGTRRRRKNEQVQSIKAVVRQLREEGLDHRSICVRLGDNLRPPRAGWRDLSWPVAYRRHTSAVRKWLSEACG